jgi:hypothetical protein
VLEELIEESKGEKGIRWRCVCVREREREESVLEELREESRGEKSIR